MSFIDKARAKAAEVVDQHGDKVAAGIDKAASMADAKTQGKHTGKIAGGAQKAKDALDSLDGKNDDIR